VLCQAALAAPVLLEQQQQQQQRLAGASSEPELQQPPVVYVANDWPTALLLLRLQYSVRQPSVCVPGAGGAASDVSSSVESYADLQQVLAQRLGAGAAAAYCIHNLAYQGVLAASSFPRLSLPPEALPALCTSHDWRDVLHGLDGMQSSSSSAVNTRGPCSSQTAFLTAGDEPQPGQQGNRTGAAPVTAKAAAATAKAASAEVAAQLAAASCSSGELNQMRSALLAADCLVTVSQGYAAEVQQAGSFGCGLHDILAARGIRCRLHCNLCFLSVGGGHAILLQAEKVLTVCSA